MHVKRQANRPVEVRYVQYYVVVHTAILAAANNKPPALLAVAAVVYRPIITVRVLHTKYTW